MTISPDRVILYLNYHKNRKTWLADLSSSQPATPVYGVAGVKWSGNETTCRYGDRNLEPSTHSSEEMWR